MVLSAYLIDHARVAARLGRCSTEKANDFIEPMYDGIQALARDSDVPGERGTLDLLHDLLCTPGAFDGAATWPVGERARAARILKEICRAHGRALPSRSWWSFRYAWFDHVSTAMRAAGHRSDVSGLAVGSPPAPWPLPDDFPIITHWRPDDARTWLAGMTGPRLTDPDEDAAVAEVYDWMSEAARCNEELVTFCE